MYIIMHHIQEKTKYYTRAYSYVSHENLFFYIKNNHNILIQVQILWFGYNSFLSL